MKSCSESVNYICTCTHYLLIISGKTEDLMTLRNVIVSRQNVFWANFSPCLHCSRMSYHFE